MSYNVYVINNRHFCVGIIEICTYIHNNVYSIWDLININELCSFEMHKTQWREQTEKYDRNSTIWQFWIKTQLMSFSLSRSFSIRSPWSEKLLFGLLINCDLWAAATTTTIFALSYILLRLFLGRVRSMKTTTNLCLYSC